MSKLTTMNLEERLTTNKIPTNQRVALHEILSASQVLNLKGRRYSEDWILLCLLFHMRSPCGYNFVRNNDIMPLPCVRTIRRYLSSIDTQCGFDPKFLQMFSLYMAQKEEFQRHGLLVFDEISTRESIAVNSANLTYTGLVDFGEEGEKGKTFSDKANHGLVFMFIPLEDNYAQPVGVFASKGPTKGVVLTQLVIKAITVLEKAGAFIHGIVCDGSAPNRKFWSEMGICGKINKVKNWFEHPTDEKRKIFVFSDTPHLFKNIRNRLYNNKELKIHENELPVKWDHFVNVYNLDKLNPGNLKVCPKLSASHIVLNSSAKMRVRLAVQILSNSMAKSLEFYRSYSPQLSDSTATENFCLKMNAAFDALNRKLKNEGVSPNSDDYKILQNTLEWLNEWEQRVIDNKIKPKHFLTNNTSEGLRVTLTSTLEICTYLKEKYGIQYILTGKINQDDVEVRKI
ncbi:unnamed protein product [Macrosiphum euphorbiae]|uniref:Transposase n=1 Tax=Macrosiphum euphorbiae TaxID=13131 RepID=A0AAV0XL06_9HEMI|nr:unnamed protein product [Macrosiphum euphorbiae]